MLDVELPQPYLLFLGDVAEPGYAKTAFGLRDWARERCVGELAFPGGAVTTGLPRLTAEAAVARGARSIVIGVANAGGYLAPSWIPALIDALRAGLDIVSGMHARLAENKELAVAAETYGRALHDVRTPPPGLRVGTGARRGGNRLLTVGTDCALGKKYTALALARAFREHGIDAEFRATGQTGIMIAGRGIPIDAVAADFVAGAAEQLSPDAPATHWDVIEGQGSLFHPSFAAVTLGLLHGSQPDVLVLCHHHDRDQILGRAGFALPSIERALDCYLQSAHLTNPAARFAGVSLNTASLSETEAASVLERAADAYGMPVADPMRGGPAFERLVERCLQPT